MGTVVLLDARLGSLRAGTPDGTADRILALAPLLVLARSRTTETSVVEVPGHGRAVRKRWWWPRASDRAKGLFRTTAGARSPARREHEALLRLRRLPSGPFAPEPLAVAEERRAGVLRQCALLLAEVRGAVDLATFLRDERDASRRAAVLGDLALRTREMHAAGLFDREHHPRNVLVDGCRTWKVDCAKQRVRRAPLAIGPVLDDVSALDVGLVRLATAQEREAFLASALPLRPDAALLARLDALRLQKDFRESARLPSTGFPRDNGR